MNPGADETRQRLHEFATWRKNLLTGDEKGEAQIFLDRLFRALGHEGIKEAGATLEERIPKNSNGGTAFADLMWKPRCLIEMKRSGVNLKTTYRQAFDYWVQAVPDRPRYVVLCNFDEFWIYDFDRQLDEPVDKIAIDELPTRWEALSFLLPVETRPLFNNDLVAVTREAAAQVAAVFNHMRSRGIERHTAQRFVLQSVMAMFAEDIGLLPSHMFTNAIDDAGVSADPGATAYDLLFSLFREMNTKGETVGGRYKGTPYFNGGLFAHIDPIELTVDELQALQLAVGTDWSAVRPEIFGTLFEQSMDAEERHAYGAHFTSQADIARIVIPTIVEPWRERIEAARARGAGGINAMQDVIDAMNHFHVLDPACGSGNFLYVAFREMRRLEHEANQAIQEMRRSQDKAAQAVMSYVTPHQFHGRDINEFAIEIAKVTMMLATKLAVDELHDGAQVLPLDNLDTSIVAADALTEPWPYADAIIGNPPYLGRQKMVQELGADYCSQLAQRYPHIGGMSDFVSYWFPLAHNHLPDGGRAGFVATNTIRQNASRTVSLDYIADNGGTIYNAVSTIPWSGDAVVMVSIVNWIKNADVRPKVLWLDNGELRLEVDHITTALSTKVDVRQAAQLNVNRNPQRCFQGQTPGVTPAFIVSRAEAKAIDPGGICTYPFLGGDSMLKQRHIDTWVIDIGVTDQLQLAALPTAVIDHVKTNAFPVREERYEAEKQRNTDARAQNPTAKLNRHHEKFFARWWQLGYRREEMLTALRGLDRYLAITRVASFERLPIFEFVDADIRPGDSLTVFSLADDYSFGVLSSSIHRAWFEARCSTLKTDLRYTSTTVWDSFPWPQSPNQADMDAVVACVKEILELREQQQGSGVTLAQMYDTLRAPGNNSLRDLHDALDAAVFKAYGFSEHDDPLAQLLALNLDIAADPVNSRGPGPAGLAGTRVTDYRLTREERFTPTPDVKAHPPRPALRLVGGSDVESS